MNDKKYGDIINLEHYHAPGRPFMTGYDRAAQFAPFKALTGFEDEINETARFTIENNEAIKKK
ncbi:MAG: hypothetical protein K6B52_01310 [Clostridiales bacterium]|nr:hypothetical protein [Clostridiales bacterium]